MQLPINRNYTHILVLFFVLGIALTSLSQQTNIDSLLKVLNKQISNSGNIYTLKDTNKLNTLHALTGQYIEIAKYDTALLYANQCISIYEKLSPSNKENKNVKKSLSGTIYYIGYIYFLQGNYPKALEMCFYGLKMSEQLSDNLRIFVLNNLIGSIYSNKKDYSKAHIYYTIALKTAEKLGDKKYVLMAITNIGQLYIKKEDYTKALEYLNKSSKIAEEIGDKANMGYVYNSIGAVFFKRKKNAQALEQHFKSLKISEEIGDKRGIAYDNLNIGATYISQLFEKQNKQEAKPQAKKHLLLALNIYKKMGLKNEVSSAYYNLSLLDSIEGNYVRSLGNYKLYILYKDSVFNEENIQKTVRTEMNYQFDKNEAAAKLEQKKKELLAVQEKERQKAIRNLFIVAFLFMLLLALFIFRTYRQKQKINLVITKQNEAISSQNKLLAEKNELISDSLEYAKGIQEALLPEIIDNPNFDVFVYYKPKDIIGGDFYWHKKINSKIEMFVGGDCAGHGVPASILMTLILELLNKFSFDNQEALLSSSVLNYLNAEIIKVFHKNQKKGNNKFCIDMSVLIFNIDKTELNYAGAKNNIYLVENAKGKEIIGDKISVGTQESYIFTDHFIKTSSALNIFLFSDGFYDQKNNVKNIKNGRFEKYGKTRFNDLLIQASGLSVKERTLFFEDAFNNWKSAGKQIDDVLVLGISYPS